MQIIYFEIFLGDISFGDGLGVETTCLLQHLFEIQPEAVKLFHFFRIWMHIVKKTMKIASFKNFQLSLFVVFYLQHENLMPSILKVQQGLKMRKIKGNETNICL